MRPLQERPGNGREPLLAVLNQHVYTGNRGCGQVYVRVTGCWPASTRACRRSTGECTRSRKNVVVAAMWGMSKLNRHPEHQQQRPEGQKDQPKALPPSTPPPPRARACGRQQSKGACRVWGPWVSTDRRASGTGLPGFPGAYMSPHADYNHDEWLPGPTHMVPVLTRSLCVRSATCAAHTEDPSASNPDASAAL